MNKPKIKANIDVAVRLRPLNTYENRAGEENAWEVRIPDYEYKIKNQHNNGPKRDCQLSLKNKFRFGFNRATQAEKRIGRSVSCAPKSNRPTRNQIPRSVSQTFIGNSQRNLDESWKYKSGVSRKDFQSVYGQRSSYQKMVNGQYFKTPITNSQKQTVFNQHFTPENNEQSDNQIYGGNMNLRGSIGNNSIIYNQGSLNLQRSSSLTAIQSFKKSKSITRSFANEYRNRFNNFSNMKMESNAFTARKSIERQTRARSAMGAKSEIAGESRNIHFQHKFKFDDVFGEHMTNQDVYKQQVKEVSMASLEGINGTVFVYGQTGTGKTYTMMGYQRTKNYQSQHGAKVVTEIYDQNGQAVSHQARQKYELQQNSGVMIFAMQDLFKKISQIEIASRELDQEVKFQIKLSYIEIYNELIYDLLVVKKQDIDQNLTINEAKNKEFHVNGANQIEVNSIDQVLELIEIGESNKHYAETFLNHCSSRSHTMFRLNIVCYKKQGNAFLQTKSYLNFVDLAGSEKISNYFGSKNTVNSDQYQMSRLKEGLCINKSLFALTQVIHLLSQKPNQHIPYRNSTLTKLLRSSLGGNSKTSIIICITPANTQIEQTMSSLKFGEKAMKVQNSAKVQVNEIKLNAIKNRYNLSSKGGIEEKILKEVVEEYETKIRNLEKLLYDNTEVYKLKKQVQELEIQRQRLIHALELQGDRTFFIKQLVNRQKQGFQEISLKHAGDIAIQSKSVSLLSVEQLLDEKEQYQNDQLANDQCNKKFIDYITKELKNYKNENSELRGECDKLENAYQDIIGQFTKMSQMQSELLKLSQPENQLLDISKIDKMTDREIQRVDNDFKKSLVKIQEERGKRSRMKKSTENLSMNSSGHLKNFMRPYNPTSFYSTNRRTSSAQSHSQRSKNSSPGYYANSNHKQKQEHELIYKDQYEATNHSRSKFDAYQEMNPEHFNSRQPITEEYILQNKNLNSTFGMRKQSKQMKANNQQKQLYNQPIQMAPGIHIDKSIYNQEKNYRPSGYTNRSQSNEQKLERSNSRSQKKVIDEKKLLLPLQMPDVPKEVYNLNNQRISIVNQQIEEQEVEEPRQNLVNQMEDDNNKNIDLPFAPINSFNQYLMQKHNLQNYEIIKEDIHNENQVSSFDNLSHSQGFDITTLPIPSSVTGMSGNHYPVPISSNSSIKNVNVVVQANAQNYNKNNEPEPAVGTFMNTPKRQILQVQPENQENAQHKLEQDSINCQTFDKTISKLSSISNNIKTKSQYDHPQKDSLVDIINEELMMEFQFEQMLNKQNQDNDQQAHHNRVQSYPQINQGNMNHDQQFNGEFQIKMPESPQFSNESKHEGTFEQIHQHQQSQKHKISNGDYVSFQNQNKHVFQNKNFQSKTEQIKDKSEKRLSKSKSKKRITAESKKNTRQSRSKSKSKTKLSKVTHQSNYNTGNSPSCTVLQTSTSNNPFVNSEQYHSNQLMFAKQSSQKDDDVRYKAVILASENHFLKQSSRERTNSINKKKEIQNSLSQHSILNQSNNSQVQTKSKKTKNFSIDLSSTMKQSEKYEISNGDQQDMFDKLCIDVQLQDNQEADQSYMQIINNSKSKTKNPEIEQHNKKLQQLAINDQYSDTLTPYGPIDTNESEKNLEISGRYDEQLDNIQGNQLLNLCIKTKTPSNLNDKDNSKHFFYVQDSKSKSGVFKSPFDAKDHDPDEHTRSVEKFVEDGENTITRQNQNFMQEGQPFSEIRFDNLQNCEREDSSQIPSQSNFSKCHTYKNSIMTTSNATSFKPGMTKEILQIEKTNQKLQKHNEQYQKIYKDMIQMNDSFDTEFKSQVSKKSIHTHRESEMAISQQNSSVNLRVGMSKQKNISRDGTNSIMSHSTSQGLTSYDTKMRNSKIMQQSKYVEGYSHRISQEFDAKSKVSGMSNKSGVTQKKSQMSKKSKSKTNIETKTEAKKNSHENQQKDLITNQNSPLAFQLINERLNHFSSQIEPNWQQKSQASLDKMQQLQKEYEQIQQRRQKIMANLDSSQSTTSVCLRDARPKVKTFEPVQRKHSPSIQFNGADHLKNYTNGEYNVSTMKKRQYEWKD